MLEKLGGFFLEILEVIVFAVAIFLFVYLVLFQPHKIKGDSMLPNFQDGEYLLSDKLSYRLGAPQRGDVIIFEAPGTNGEEFIKRIIGLPGETVAIENNQVMIDGRKLEEKYIPNNFVTEPGSFARSDMPLKISENSYFVLGDNRSHSSDSRAFGLIDKEAITGRAWVVYWPLSIAGKIEHVEYNFN